MRRLKPSTLQRRANKARNILHELYWKYLETLDDTKRSEFCITQKYRATTVILNSYSGFVQRISLKSWWILHETDRTIRV